MLKNPGRKPQNKFIGVGNPSILQPAYVPPKIGHNVKVFPIPNYKELQQEAFEAREIVGQLKRANLFTVKNNMSANLAYGDDTIVLEDVNVKNSQGQNILTEIEKQARIAKNNSRFDYKRRFPDTYNFKKTHFFDRGEIFSEDEKENEAMLDNYHYQLYEEEIEKQEHNEKVKDDINKMKGLTLMIKAYNKGMKTEKINRFKNILSLLSQDKKNIMRRDIPTRAGDVGDMDEQIPEIGDFYYMDDQSPTSLKDSIPSHISTDEDTIEMLLQDRAIQNLVSEEAEVRKISGDDEEEEEERDEGVTTQASDTTILNTLGEITFPGIRYYTQTAITQYSNVMNCVVSSTDSNQIKKRGFEKIIYLLEEKKKEDKKNITIKSPESRGYKTAEHNIKAANHFIDVTTEYMNKLDLKEAAIEEPKTIKISKKTAGKKA